MTYSTQTIALTLLLSGCLSESDNVGEIPPGGQLETSDTDTMGTPSTTGETDPGATGDTETGGTETGGTESSGTESSGTETGPVGGCLDQNYNCFSGDYTPLDCGAELACDALEVNDPTLNEFDEEPFGFVNPEAATCILEALAAGEVGVYRINVEPGQQYSSVNRLEVLSDGSVVQRSEFHDDKVCNASDRRSMLQPSAYFEGCQAEVDESLVLDCLLAAGDPAQCVDDGAICPQ